MGWPELPDEWTYRPWWVPPYPIPYNFPAPLITKKSVVEVPQKPYYFFDTPDHEDCFKKIFNICNYGIRIAACVSTSELIATKQLSYAKAFGRVAFYFGRIGGSALMYSSVTCAVANLRGRKNDELNHIIGGASVGLVWGYKYHSLAIGAMVAVASGFAAMLTKRAHTPTEQFPNGWAVLVTPDIMNVREENGVLGGQRFGDLRIGWVLADPGRKSLD